MCVYAVLCTESKFCKCPFMKALGTWGTCNSYSCDCQSSGKYLAPVFNLDNFSSSVDVMCCLWQQNSIRTHGYFQQDIIWQKISVECRVLDSHFVVGIACLKWTPKARLAVWYINTKYKARNKNTMLFQYKEEKEERQKNYGEKEQVILCVWLNGNTFIFFLFFPKACSDIGYWL